MADEEFSDDQIQNNQNRLDKNVKQEQINNVQNLHNVHASLLNMNLKNKNLNDGFINIDENDDNNAGVDDDDEDNLSNIINALEDNTVDSDNKNNGDADTDDDNDEDSDDDSDTKINNFNGMSTQKLSEEEVKTNKFEKNVTNHLQNIWLKPYFTSIKSFSRVKRCNTLTIKKTLEEIEEPVYRPDFAVVLKYFDDEPDNDKDKNNLTNDEMSNCSSSNSQQQASSSCSSGHNLADLSLIKKTKIKKDYKYTYYFLHSFIFSASSSVWDDEISKKLKQISTQGYAQVDGVAGSAGKSIIPQIDFTDNIIVKAKHFEKVIKFLYTGSFSFLREEGDELRKMFLDEHKKGNSVQMPIMSDVFQATVEEPMDLGQLRKKIRKGQRQRKNNKNENHQRTNKNHNFNFDKTQKSNSKNSHPSGSKSKRENYGRSHHNHQQNSQKRNQQKYQGKNNYRDDNDDFNRKAMSMMMMVMAKQMQN